MFYCAYTQSLVREHSLTQVQKHRTLCWQTFVTKLFKLFWAWTENTLSVWRFTRCKLHGHF